MNNMCVCCGGGSVFLFLHVCRGLAVGQHVCVCVCVCVCSGTHLSNDVRYLLLKVLETFLSYDTLHQIQSGRVSRLTWLVLPLPLEGVVHQVALNNKKKITCIPITP